MRKITLISLLLCLSIGCCAQLKGEKLTPKWVELESSPKSTSKGTDDKKTVFQPALQGEADFRLMSSYRQAGLNGKARVILIADAVYGNEIGCQLLLDADCTTHNQVITSDLGLWNSDYYAGTDYSAFEYKIPADATTNPEDRTFITDGKKDSVDIPAGRYDMCIVRDRRYKLELATGQNWENVNFSGDFVYVFYFHYGFMDNATASTLKYDLGISPKWDWGAGTLSNAQPVQFVLKNYGHVAHNKPVKCYYQLDNETPVMYQLNQAPEPGKNTTVTFSKPADLSALRLYNFKMWIEDELGWTTSNDTMELKVNNYTPLEIPYKEGFNIADKDKFMNLWTIANLNDNENTWEFYENKDADGNEASGCMNYDCNDKANADELLISPRLKATAGEHNLHFQFRTGGSQKMKIYVNTKPSVEGAELIDELIAESTDGAWMDQYYNFTRQNNSPIYIIFHLISGNDTKTLMIDNIEVSEGKLELISDVIIEHITPPVPTCDMHQWQSLKVKLKNNGALPGTKYILNAKLNDGKVFTTEFTQVIPSFGSTEVTLPLEDEGFTTPGFHNISVWGTCEQQANPITEQVTSTTHFTVGELPLNTSFVDEECYKNWAPVDPAYWEFMESLGYWNCTLSQEKANNIQPDLLSRCMLLKAGKTYRIEICYIGGLAGRTDEFEVLVGKSYNSSKYYTSIGKVSNIQKAYSEWATFTFTVEEDDEYALAIRSWQESFNLAFEEIYINEVFENDITTAKVKSNLYPQMPAHMIKGVASVFANVRNHGTADITNAKIEVKVGEQTVATSSERKNIPSDSTTIITSTANFNDLIINKGKVDLNIYSSFDKADDFDKDNHYTYSVLVTDTVMAREATTDYGYGIGVSKATVGFGVPYDLIVSDTLTSISLGFAIGPSQEFTFAIYKYETNPETGVKYPTEKIYEIEKLLRPELLTETELCTYSIRPTVLPAGKYFFEVRQSISTYLLLAVTKPLRDKDGEVYTHQNGLLYQQPGFGEFVFRANFAPVKHLAKDIKVHKITKPTPRGIFTSNEKVEVVISNETFVTSESFKAYCKTGTQIKEQTVPSLNAHEERTITFEVDLSKVGMHDICVYTALQGDQVSSNDSAKITVESVSPNLDPYSMDFEHCTDFATDVLFPSWTMADEDQLTTYGISGYSFPGMFSKMAFIVFNPSLVEFEFMARSGERFGACMGATNGATNNDWLISPNLPLGKNSKLTLSVNTMQYEEKYHICVSTTDNKPSSFTPIEKINILTGGQWVDREVDLSKYDNSPVFYIAIQCVSEQSLMLAVDDIKVHTSPSSIENVHGSNVKLYPNPVQDFFIVQSPSSEITQIRIFDMLGNELYRSGKINENNHYVDVNYLDRGNYIVVVQTAKGVSKHKLIKK